MAKRKAKAATAAEVPDQELQYDAILDSAAELKSAIESKDTDKLEDLLGNAPVWVNNKPGSIGKLVNSLETLTGNATDLELTVSRILDTELDKDEASVTLECQLVWSNPETWEEREASFELHIGLGWKNGGWAFTHLAVLPRRGQFATPGIAQHAPAIDTPYFESHYNLTGHAGAYFESFAGAALPYFGVQAAESMPYFSASHVSAFPYFEAAGGMASSFFQQETVPAPAAPVQPEAGDGPAGYVTVYMPVFVPVSLFKK